MPSRCFWLAAAASSFVGNLCSCRACSAALQKKATYSSVGPIPSLYLTGRLRDLSVATVSALSLPIRISLSMFTKATLREPFAYVYD